MRLLILTPPGEKYGPCRTCAHDECDELRQVAASQCHLCGSLVGYNRALCYDADKRPVHFACLAVEVDRHALLLGLKSEEVRTPLAPLTYDKPTAAKLLNLSESTINELIASGELSRVKVGTRVTFTPQMLTAFIQRKSLWSKHDRLKAVS